MPSLSRPPRSSWARTVLLLTVILAGGRVRAADRPILEGFPAGPWLLAPALVAGWSHDSNLFYRSRLQDPSGDQVRRLVPQIRAQLPFRNSDLELGYQRTFVDYHKTSFEGNGFQEMSAALRLRFSTHDTLEATGAHTRGRAEFLRFDGGELVFDGQPYRLNEWAIGLSREEAGHRGYALRVVRTDLNFGGDVQVQFFDFRSLSMEGEYREPVGPRSWILTAVRFESAEQFCRARTQTGAPCPGVGVPFRFDRRGTVRFGVRGLLGENEPFFLRVGKEVRQFRYPIRATSELVADGLLTLRLAPSTRLYVTARRDLWPSFYRDNDFYVSQQADVRVERLGRSRTQWGATLTLQTTGYPIPDPSGPRRRDRRVSGEAYATLLARDRAGVRVSVARHRKSSNIEGFDYEGTVVFAGIVLGWF